MIRLLVYAGTLIVALGISYGLWWVGKKTNYSFQYESMVVETIKKNVKQECLK